MEGNYGGVKIIFIFYQNKHKTFKIIVQDKINFFKIEDSLKINFLTCTVCFQQQKVSHTFYSSLEN